MHCSQAAILDVGLHQSQMIEKKQLHIVDLTSIQGASQKCRPQDRDYLSPASYARIPWPKRRQFHSHKRAKTRVSDSARWYGTPCGTCYRNGIGKLNFVTSAWLPICGRDLGRKRARITELRNYGDRNYGDSALIRGFLPRTRGLRVRPAAVSRRSRKRPSPSGLPIVSALRSLAESSWSSPAASRAAKSG